MQDKGQTIGQDRAHARPFRAAFRVLPRLPFMICISALLAGCATVGGDAPSARLVQPLKAALASEQIGEGLDDKARSMAASAEYRALETGVAGVPVAWRASNAVFGTVTPQQPYTVGATNCRRYTHSVSVSGQSNNASATACRNEDGAWVPLS